MTLSERVMTMKREMTELKPCAKCGGEPELIDTNIGGRIVPAIKCKRCGNKYRQLFWDRDKLIHAWNIRTEGRE